MSAILLFQGEMNVPSISSMLSFFSPYPATAPSSAGWIGSCTAVDIVCIEVDDDDDAG
jgi:hypothetical protein